MINFEKFKEMLKYFYFVIPLVILLLVMHRCEVVKSSKLEKELQSNYNMMRVLHDSIHTVTTKNGELISYKNSFQNDMKSMKSNYDLMTENQKALYNEIKSSKKLITAMRADMTVRLDSLINNDQYTINSDSTSVTFSDSTTDLKYNISVNGIKPISPELVINNLELPNKQLVTHEFTEDGGVKVTIKNSNKFFKTNDVDGYIIPQVTEDVVKPNKWKKVWNTTKKVAIGVAIGAFTLAVLIAASN